MVKGPIVKSETTQRITWFYGPVRVIAPAIRIVGCSYQYDARRHGYAVPVQYADDIADVIKTGRHHARVEPAVGWL